MLVLKKMAHTDPEKLPSWSDSTDAEIVNALQAHYDPNDPTDLTKIWSVGDEREITLSAISGLTNIETHSEQSATLVLLNQGGKKLADGVTECAFVVGLKKLLNKETYDSSAYIYRGQGILDSTGQTQSGGWANWERRTWCNNQFRAAIPANLRDIFKQHINESMSVALDSSDNKVKPITVTTTDYFALPSFKEIGSYHITPQNPFLVDTTKESNMPVLEYFTITPNLLDMMHCDNDYMPFGLRSETYYTSASYPDNRHIYGSISYNNGFSMSSNQLNSETMLYLLGVI